jgi:hypothetical protein
LASFFIERMVIWSILLYIISISVSLTAVITKLPGWIKVMKILEETISKGLGLAPKSLTYLTPRLLKLVPATGLPADPTYRVMLGEASVSEIAPGAPNQEAVRTNYATALQNASKIYDEGMAEFKKLNQGSNWLADLGVSDFRDYVRLNLSLCQQPLSLYFAGHELIAATRLKEELVLAQYQSLNHFKDYANHLPGGMLVHPLHLRHFATEIAADIHAGRILASINSRLLTITSGAASDTISMELIPAGDCIFILLQAPANRQEYQIAEHEVADLLRRYRFKDMWIKCCCTCANFRISGMSGDMTSGQAGYCNLRVGEALSRHGQSGFQDRKDSYEAIVSITDLCSDYKHEEKCRPG